MLTNLVNQLKEVNAFSFPGNKNISTVTTISEIIKSDYYFCFNFVPNCQRISNSILILLFLFYFNPPVTIKLKTDWELKKNP